MGWRAATNKFNASSHSAKHMNKKPTCQQPCSICSLNVHPFKPRGQLKAPQPRQTDTLYVTQPRHICLGAAGGVAPLKSSEHLKMGAFVRRAGETPAFVKPSVQNTPTRLGLKDAVAPFQWAPLCSPCHAGSERQRTVPDPGGAALPPACPE